MLTSDSDEEMRIVWKQRADDLVWREIENEVIVLDLRSAQYLSLNATGALLWEALENEQSHLQLAELLAERFGLDEGTARHDTRVFIDACASLQLIERKNEE